VRADARPLRTSLFWRVFAINASLLVLAALVVGVSPLTLSTPLAVRETVVLTVGLALMLAANLALLRPAFSPLERLAQRMRDVDLLRPGQRLAISGGGEVATLVQAFNEMIDRLEAERRESGGRALAAQEAERARIARGLHDEVGQAMTSVLLQLKRIEPVVPPARRGDLSEAQQTVRDALEEVRRIAQELRPELLEHLGLVSALTALATAFQRRTGVAVERRFARDLPALAPDVELAVYRVVQEGLTNVARHAGARTVQLSVEPGRRSVVVRLVDDGRGFAGERPAEGGGLRGMRERAVMVGAALAVKPAATGGVEIRLEAPAAEA
jgi:two-component system sensor histidine kinase UhpB